MNEINVVPYIDVMLVLLIIFMVTAPMITPSVIDLLETHQDGFRHVQRHDTRGGSKRDQAGTGRERDAISRILARENVLLAFHSRRSTSLP
ncbi:biopolymer transporter ExbD [Mycobacterium tuberculosis]|uniref:biopolymer transporter ExbD n=1 Tax=Mycobacterium tuberculosis TaxID=1773 RepID=UPI003F8C89CD